MSRALFGTIVSIILITISYITAKMYSLGLRFDAVGTRITFFVFLIIPVLFVGSIMLTRSTHTIVTPTLYREIQLIAGVAFYISIGAVLVGIVLLSGALLRIHIPPYVTLCVLGLSLIAAAVGYMQSRFIRVVRYEIQLAGAPATWEGKTAVLVSDTHFGLVNYKKFSDTVVSTIEELHPDFVLHAGDFYDGPYINTDPISKSWQQLAEKTPVFFAPGNHDTYGDYDTFLASIKKAGVHVLDDKSELYDGIQLAGITYRDGKDPTGAREALESLSLTPGTPTILINHPPTALGAAASQGVVLQVSGHTHKGQFWPMNFLIRKIYGQYYYGKNMYDTMQVITTSGVGTFGPPMRLFNPPEVVLITFHAK